MLQQKTYLAPTTKRGAAGAWDERKIGRVWSSNSAIFHQGDTARHLFKVNSGFVMTFRLLKDSKRQITGFCTEGDFFGLSPDQIYHDSAVTVTASNILSLTMADVRADEQLQAELFNGTCGRLEDAQNMMMTLSKKSAGEKVAYFLLMLAKRQSPSLDGETEELDVNLPMSRLDVADYLGLTIETVSRRLTELKRRGVIDLPDRNHANICQLSELVHMAGAAA